MSNKLYDKIKNIIKENYKFILILLVFFFLFTFELPYYIETPGGILDVSTRVEVEDSNNIKGSFNLAYVTEFKATIPTLIIASFSNDWDVLKKQEVEQHETIEEIEYRNHLMLEEANSNATILAFNKAGEYINVTNKKVNVVYIDKEANTDLKVGDQIISVDGVNIDNKEMLFSIIESKDDKFEFTVINNGVEYKRYGYKSTIEDKSIIGIVISETKDVDTNLDVRFKFKKSESGPSGGFMMALAIYNYLTIDDITNGLKIVGTGTIDEVGNVGSIGGVEYKVKAAAKEKADLFLVPKDNYKDAYNTILENNLDIKLVSISTFDEALDYLKNM